MNPSLVPPVLIGSSTLFIGEAILGVIVISMLAVILVLKKRAAEGGKPAPAAKAPEAMYPDLNQAATPQTGAATFGGEAGHADPFAGFAGAPSGQVAAQPPQPAAPAVGNPAPGTPASWLPDPSGTPNTLRYWDGNAWTQHVAQRS